MLAVFVTSLSTNNSSVYICLAQYSEICSPSSSTIHGRLCCSVVLHLPHLKSTALPPAIMMVRFKSGLWWASRSGVYAARKKEIVELLKNLPGESDFSVEDMFDD